MVGSSSSSGSSSGSIATTEAEAVATTEAEVAVRIIMARNSTGGWQLRLHGRVPRPGQRWSEEAASVLPGELWRDFSLRWIVAFEASVCCFDMVEPNINI